MSGAPPMATSDAGCGSRTHGVPAFTAPTARTAECRLTLLDASLRCGCTVHAAVFSRRAGWPRRVPLLPVGRGDPRQRKTPRLE